MEPPSSSEPKRQRGEYRSYMRLPNAKPPKTTLYRMRRAASNITQNAQANLPPPEIPETQHESQEEPVCMQTDPDSATSVVADEVSTHEDATGAVPLLENEAFIADEEHSTSSEDSDSEAAQEPADEVEPTLRVPKKIDALEELCLPNIPTTKFEALLMVYNIAFRHSLTHVATEDLCKLINSILGAEYIPTSKYMLKKIFGTMSYSYHFYCSSCQSYIGEFRKEDPRKEVLICPVETCRKECDLRNMNDGCFFITLPIKEQIAFLLENMEDAEELLSYRWNQPNDTENIRDLFDGILYRELTEEGNILSQKFSASVTAFTDGAVVFDSSNNSLWTIQLRLNELPPSMRFDQSNAMVAGLWFSNKAGQHPNMELFMTGCVKEINELSTTGVQWLSSNGEVITSIIHFFSCVLDSIAKPIVQNIKQFNGYYGCGYCYHPGVVIENCGSNHAKYIMDDNLVLMDDYSSSYTVTKYDKEQKRVRPFAVEDRNDRKMREEMEEAERLQMENEFLSKEPHVKGVKGKSPLAALFFFNMVFGFAIDYMHCVLLGVVKHVTAIWFDTSRAFHLNDAHVKKIDRRLLKIKPPTSISRRPRSIGDRVHWKGNEWRSWLLFYSLPCLYGIIPTAHLKHHCLLVSSCWILLQENITRSDLSDAAWYLLMYVKEFSQLYGESNMLYNVHLLLHLTKMVLYQGPLWCFSAFSFESGNGCLVKLVKGTRSVITQIAEKYATCKLVTKTITLYSVSERVMSFCADIMCYRLASNVFKVDDVTLLGIEKHITLTEQEKRAFADSALQSTEMAYERMIKNKVLYHARCYARMGAKSDNSIVKLSRGTFAAIERFVVVKNIAGDQHLHILVRHIQTERNQSITSHSSGAKATHIKVCSSRVYGELQFVEPAELLEKAILITCGDDVGSFVATFPNKFEKD